MLGDMGEVFVCRKQHYLVPNAELREQCINGADLDSRPTASVAQSCCVDVVIPIWLEEW